MNCPRSTARVARFILILIAAFAWPPSLAWLSSQVGSSTEAAPSIGPTPRSSGIRIRMKDDLPVRPITVDAFNWMKPRSRISAMPPS